MEVPFTYVISHACREVEQKDTLIWIWAQKTLALSLSLCDAKILYCVLYKKVVEQWCQHSLVWYTRASSLRYHPHPNGSDSPVFSHWTDLQPLSGSWKAWRNAVLRKQIHYSSCQTFIKWIIVGRKYLKISFFFPVK